MLLALKKFFSTDLLKTYGKDGSDFMNHIIIKFQELSFHGSLGHGSYATGIALGHKMKGLDSKVYVILGDGEVAEGSNWEALLFSSHHILNNLVIIIDNNYKVLLQLMKL